MSLKFWLLIASSAVIYVCCKAARVVEDDSTAYIVGGTFEEGHPEVKLVVTDPARGGICTGVAVSDTTMLIGAHCVTRATYDRFEISMSTLPATRLKH